MTTKSSVSSYRCGAQVKQYQRVYDAGNFLRPAGDSELENGFAERDEFPGRAVAVFSPVPGTIQTCIASGPIVANTFVYRANGGLVSSSGTSQLGRSLSAATAAGDHVDVVIAAAGGGGAGSVAPNVVEHVGEYNPVSNSPAISDATGSHANFYKIRSVTATTTRNFGSGNIDFVVGQAGDLIHDGVKWVWFPNATSSSTSDRRTHLATVAGNIPTTYANATSTPADASSSVGDALIQRFDDALAYSERTGSGSWPVRFTQAITVGLRVFHQSTTGNVPPGYATMSPTPTDANSSVGDKLIQKFDDGNIAFGTRTGANTWTVDFIDYTELLYSTTPVSGAAPTGKKLAFTSSALWYCDPADGLWKPITIGSNLYLGLYNPTTNTPSGIADGSGTAGQEYDVVAPATNQTRNFGSGNITFPANTTGRLRYNGTIWQFNPIPVINEVVLSNGPPSGAPPAGIKVAIDQTTGEPYDVLTGAYRRIVAPRTAVPAGTFASGANPLASEVQAWASNAANNIRGPAIVYFNRTVGNGGPASPSTSNPEYVWFVGYDQLVTEARSPNNTTAKATAAPQSDPATWPKLPLSATAVVSNDANGRKELIGLTKGIESFPVHNPQCYALPLTADLAVGIGANPEAPSQTELLLYIGIKALPIPFGGDIIEYTSPLGVKTVYDVCQPVGTLSLVFAARAAISTVDECRMTIPSHGFTSGNIGTPINERGGLFDDTDSLKQIAILKAIVDANTVVVTLPHACIRLPIAKLNNGAGYSYAVSGRWLYYDASLGQFTSEANWVDADPGLEPSAFLLGLASTYFEIRVQ